MSDTPGAGSRFVRFFGGVALGLLVVAAGVVVWSVSTPVPERRIAEAEPRAPQEREPVAVISPEAAPADTALPGPVPQPSPGLNPGAEAPLPDQAIEEGGFSPPEPFETPGTAQRPDLPQTATLEGPAPAVEQPTVENPAFELQEPALTLNSASFERRGDSPIIAVILEDAGASDLSVEALLSLPMPLTLGITPRGEADVKLASEAKLANYEVLTEIPIGRTPRALISPEMSDLEIAEMVERVMAELWMSVGASGVMAEDGPLDERIMKGVITVLERNGFAFVNTDAGSLESGRAFAQAFSVPYAGDTRRVSQGAGEEAIYQMLTAAAEEAQTTGSAIVSGPASLAMLRALSKWSIENARVAQIAPLSAVINAMNGS